MPEVNEIRHFADFIKQKLKNEKINEINIINGRYKKHGPFENYEMLVDLLPLKLINVKTKGKFMYMVFPDELFLFSTLGLSGGWCYLKNGSNQYEFSKNMKDYEKYYSKEKNAQYINNALNHLNVEFKTKHGTLYYYDVLSFGTLKVVDGLPSLNNKLSTIGPDIMDSTTDFEIFKNRIVASKNINKKIGIVLLDQKTVSGIGNYLRSDILYISKISPFRKVKYLSNKEIKKIFINSKILTWGVFDKKKAIKLNIINEKTKFPSDYDKLFYVYAQYTDIYGNNVIKKELYEGSQKRYIYYVPKIQK